jgi:cytochrome b561
MLKDSSSGYGLITIVLHWLSAVLIVFLFALGFYMVDLGYYDPWYHRAPALHISVGLLLLLLTVVRLGWLLFNPKPVPLDSYSRATRLLSSIMKYLLYFIILVVITTGYLITSADGKSPSMFDLLDFPVFVQLESRGVDRAGEIHELFAWGLILLAAMHAAAALLHHFVKRDRTLVRMLKPQKNRPNIDS